MATVAHPAIDTEQTIRALAQEWANFYNERNLDKLMAMITEDACFLAPFHPMAEGPKAVRKLIEQMIKDYDPRKLNVVTANVEARGDLAVSFGNFEMNIRAPNGRRLDDMGKWMVTMRRIAGEWRITGHCFNTDLPMTSLMGGG